MSMNFKRLLPIPKEIREEMPLSPEMRERKGAFDAAVSACSTAATRATS